MAVSRVVVLEIVVEVISKNGRICRHQFVSGLVGIDDLEIRRGSANQLVDYSHLSLDDLGRGSVCLCRVVVVEFEAEVEGVLNVGLRDVD